MLFHIRVCIRVNAPLSSPEKFLFVIRLKQSSTPIWQYNTHGSLWAIQMVVASAIPAESKSIAAANQPNPSADVIYLVAAGSSAHAHLPGVGQSFAYDLEFSQ